MKKLLVCFLTLLMPLFSEELPQDHFPNIKESWDWNNKYFFLDIELDEGLQFDDGYITLKFPNDDPGAEIQCFPVQGSTFIKDGYPLKNVTITVLLYRDTKNHLINYKILEEFVYEKAGWFTNSKKSITTTITGNITNIDVDTDEDPAFVEKSPNKGYFSFKKRL